MSPSTVSRRQFLRTGSLALAAACSAPAGRAAAQGAARTPLFSAMGIAAPLDKAALLKAAGAGFLTESVGNLLVPDQDDQAFARNLAKLAESPLPILACNSFIRAKDLICIGPDANHDRVVEWAAVCFRRLQQAKGKFIVFGSSGTRRIPDGWTKAQADTQFVSLLKRLGPLAEEREVTLVVEQLRAEECNYINRISEGAALIRAAGHPNVRMLADFFHMATMGDTPADLKAAMDVVVHIEIAEKNGRTVPGVSGDDFRPYLKVLREAGYHGAISIEGKWTEQTIGPAFREIGRQAEEV